MLCAEHDVRARMAERVDPLHHVAQVGLVEPGRPVLRVGGHDLEVVGGVVGGLEPGEVVGREYQQRAGRGVPVQPEARGQLRRGEGVHRGRPVQALQPRHQRHRADKGADQRPQGAAELGQQLGDEQRAPRRREQEDPVDRLPAVALHPQHHERAEREDGRERHPAERAPPQRDGGGRAQPHAGREHMDDLPGPQLRRLVQDALRAGRVLEHVAAAEDPAELRGDQAVARRQEAERR